MFLNKQLITYIFIIIFIIITLLHLYKININNDNKKEVFEDLMEEQNLQGFDVYINNMSQVKFGIKPNTRSLLTSMNEKASREELTTTKTELNSNIQTEITKMQTDLSVGLSDKATKKELNEAMPELSIIAYSGSNAPIGWQPCDGTTLYYKTGEAVNENQIRFSGMNKSGSTVNTPDLRGRFILGSGGGTGLTIRPLNQIGGAETHTLSIAEMPHHNHGHNIVRSWDDGEGNDWQLDMGSGDGSPGTDIQIYGNGGNGAHNNMPPFYVLTYIIKQPSKL
jgi:microcystin-dependent protein